MISNSRNHLVSEAQPYVLVLTMPRSGTWYCEHFFTAYDKLLQEITRFHVENWCPRKGIGVAFMGIEHCICPDFERYYHGPHRVRWDRLSFYVPGFVSARERIEKAIEHFSPLLNPGVKIIHLCRNPLDQMVSFFRHALNHVDEAHRYTTDERGEKRLIQDYRDYLYSVGVDAFIKQHFTFKVMERDFDQNIKIFSYESLKRSPQRVFSEMLSFIGRPIDDERRRKACRDALVISSVPNLRKLEEAGGRTLAGDQVGFGESHMRGGRIGKWKHIFSDEDVAYVRRRFAEFDMDLDDFTLE